MRGGLKFLPIFVAIFLLAFESHAIACSVQKEREEFFVLSKKDKGDKCASVEVHFLKEIPSREDWVWSNPWITFEAQNMHFNLDIFGGGQNKAGYSYVGFCLPENMLKDSVVTITYEEYPTKKPKPNKEGITMYEVSFCNHSIVIDNLDELIAQKK